MPFSCVSFLTTIQRFICFTENVVGLMLTWQNILWRQYSRNKEQLVMEWITPFSLLWPSQNKIWWPSELSKVHSRSHSGERGPKKSRFWSLKTLENLFCPISRLLQKDGFKSQLCPLFFCAHSWSVLTYTTSYTTCYIDADTLWEDYRGPPTLNINTLIGKQIVFLCIFPLKKRGEITSMWFTKKVIFSSFIHFPLSRDTFFFSGSW